MSKISKKPLKISTTSLSEERASRRHSHMSLEEEELVRERAKANWQIVSMIGTSKLMKQKREGGESPESPRGPAVLAQLVVEHAKIKTGQQQAQPPSPSSSPLVTPSFYRSSGLRTTRLKTDLSVVHLPRSPRDTEPSSMTPHEQDGPFSPTSLRGGGMVIPPHLKIRFSSRTGKDQEDSRPQLTPTPLSSSSSSSNSSYSSSSSSSASSKSKEKKPRAQKREALDYLDQAPPPSQRKVAAYPTVRGDDAAETRKGKKPKPRRAGLTVSTAAAAAAVDGAASSPALDSPVDLFFTHRSLKHSHPHDADRPVTTYSARRDELDEKPRFLMNLEQFLEDEVVARDCPAEGPNEETMEVHRRCWDLFIENTRAYRPLLAAIKKEYDDVLEMWRQSVSYIDPLKAKLATMAEEREARKKELLARHAAELAPLEARFEENKSRIRALRFEEASLLEEHERLMAQLAAADVTLSERQNSNTLLLKGLKNVEEAEEKQIEADDKYRRESEAARKGYLNVITDFEKNLVEFQELKAVVDTMVPRKELQDVLENTQVKQRVLYVIKGYAQQAQEEHQEKVNEFRRVTQSYENLTRELESLRCRTPRPNWNSAVDHMSPGTTMRPQAHSSAEIVEALYAEMDRVVAEIQAVKAQLPKKYTEEEVFGRQSEYLTLALGTGPTVPAYLRGTGKIRNRKIDKGVTEGIIKEVWNEKEAYDRKLAKEGKPRSSLPDFFFLFLQKRYGLQSAIAEWGYNLTDSLDRFKWDGDCKLFLDILTGDLDEDVYADQMAMLKRLEDTFTKVDAAKTAAKGGKPSGLLKRKKLLSVVAKFFPVKSAENLWHIHRALDEDMPGLKVINYKQLMQEDRKGNQGEFVEVIREQHLSEREAYLADIEAGIRELDIHKTGMTTVILVRQAFANVDPKKHPKEVEAHLLRGLALQDTGRLLAFGNSTEFPINDFLKRLRPGNIACKTKKAEDWKPPAEDEVPDDREGDETLPQGAVPTAAAAAAVVVAAAAPAAAVAAPPPPAAPAAAKEKTGKKASAAPAPSAAAEPAAAVVAVAEHARTEAERIAALNTLVSKNESSSSLLSGLSEDEAQQQQQQPPSAKHPALLKSPSRLLARGPSVSSLVINKDASKNVINQSPSTARVKSLGSRRALNMTEDSATMSFSATKKAI
jgi:hypothetical protein